MLRKFIKVWFFDSPDNRRFRQNIKAIAEVFPENIELYKLATKHRSIARQNDIGLRESNERLEYLGDAILGSVVAEYLFKKFPLKDEGFLTEIRSRIVNRDALNIAAKNMGIINIVEYSDNRKNRLAYKSIFGDTLEALIGAIYLDKGYKLTRRFIVNKILKQQYDLDRIVNNNPNYKSKIIEWAHRQSKEIRFEISEIRGDSHNREFKADLILEGDIIAHGMGFSKKKAEQDAAQKSCEKLQIE